MGSEDGMTPMESRLLGLIDRLMHPMISRPIRTQSTYWVIRFREGGNRFGVCLNEDDSKPHVVRFCQRQDAEAMILYTGLQDLADAIELAEDDQE